MNFKKTLWKAIPLLAVSLSSLTSCDKEKMERIMDILYEEDTVFFHTTDTVYVDNTNKSTLFEYEGLTNANIRVNAVRVLDKSTTNTVQGLAGYGKFIAQAYDMNPCVDIYEAETGKLVETVTGTNLSTTHCNNASFSHTFFDEDDPYPLLYLQERGALHKTRVFRIVPTDTTSHLEQIQLITLNTSSSATTTIDMENNLMCIRHSGKKDGAAGTYITTVRVPNPFVGDITLDVTGDGVRYSCWTPATTNNQDCAVFDGKMFMVRGNNVESSLVIIDITNGDILSNVDLRAAGIYSEPEGCTHKDGSLFITNINASLYKLNFVKTE